MDVGTEVFRKIDKYYRKGKVVAIHGERVRVEWFGAYGQNHHSTLKAGSLVAATPEEDARRRARMEQRRIALRKMNEQRH